MDEKSFAYWLQGFFEMTDAKVLSPNQVLMIKEHLKLVFKKETPVINPQWPNGVSPPPLVWPNPDVHKVEITCGTPGQSELICSTGIVPNLTCGLGKSDTGTSWPNFTCGIGTSAVGTSGPVFTQPVISHNSGSHSFIPSTNPTPKKPHHCGGGCMKNNNIRFC